MVHCCCGRTLKNYLWLSKLVTDWTLQYRYAAKVILQNRKEGGNASNSEVRPQRNNVVKPVLPIISVDEMIIDWVAALEEFPGFVYDIEPQ